MATSRTKKRTDWDLVELVLSSERPERTLLYGPPGTGKTTAAIRMGQPEKVFNVTLTEETPAAELRGHYVPVKGEFVWRDGVIASAWRTGSRLVLNEIDHGSGDVLTLLMVALDDPEVAMLSLPTGETIRPEPGYHVVATMNGEPGDLPPAVHDRFPITRRIGEPHPDAVKSLPSDLRDVAKRSVGIDDPERAKSMRAWKAFAQFAEVHGAEIAAELVFGGSGQDVVDALAIAKSSVPKVKARKI